MILSFLAEAGGNRHAFKPKAPALVEMALHLDLIFASAGKIGLVHWRLHQGYYNELRKKRI